MQTAESCVNRDFQDAFDASYLNYLLDWWEHVCPQPGMGATGFDNPMLAQWAAEHPERANALPTGPTIGTEDCLHLAVFTPEVMRAWKFLISLTSI